jgi:ubiquinol-cytochrome c reductase cytochrome b subunit
VATLSFYAICFLGAASDIIASTFQLSVNRILITFRVAVIVVPVLTASITYRLCRELAARDGVADRSKVRFSQILGRLLHGTPRRGD